MNGARLVEPHTEVTLSFIRGVDEMAPYVILLVVLAVWAFVALRDEPQLRPYVIIYGINLLVAFAAQGSTAIFLDLYTFGGFAGLFLVTMGIEPLLGVLYAHYSDRWPFLKALGAGIILGGPLEWVFLQTGAYQYHRGWHPALTVFFFTTYFLWTHWLKRYITSGQRSPTAI
jgi:hypothetical protein